MYKPEPVDLSDIVVPDSLNDLVEEIAENVHDVWAQSRVNEGWTYGPKRDDVLKQTPCLVAYDELPEIEKEYDRNTAMSTVKLMIKLGYKVEKE